MTRETPRHPDLEADRRADRRTWIYFAVFLFASFIVLALSDQYDMKKAGAPYPDMAWVSQATSHAVILVMTPFITFMLSRYPLGAWRRTLPMHLGAVVIFSAVHILAMVALRKLLSPLIFGVPYDFGLADPSTWLYEFRKDVLSYALIAALFSLNRLAEQRSLEAEAARKEARERHRLTLKSGGRTFFVEADRVIWAKAASNYVEVITPDRTILARSTLTELERLLDAAGGRHVRVHRSHLVNMDHVREIEPTGEGDVTLTLDTGDTVPGSRRYREKYEAFLTPGEPSAL
ncbi:LytR/AlgR family response regulator transcription factor [Henriciella aquimarina]|uniref:LytR/AlgR family response regulator transcription factor n=1 Tax=Henriciella aquimarina TaxID=545261 RepID=UPI000A03FE2B|nr:LytTR family DNA-binding domain-containing protein [Henriciella aquimarina]